MIRFLLRRLLLLVPTVWFILSVVFLLSRVIPGTFEDRLAEAEQSVIGGSGQPGFNRQQAGRPGPEAERAKPLFYFSLHSLSRPDTLAQVFPPRHQLFLKDLAATYGNWPLVADYYHRLLQLQKSVAGRSADPPPPAMMTERVRDLFGLSAPAQIQQALTQIRTALKAGTRQSHVLPVLEQAEKSFRQMKAQARPWQAFIPVITWHGAGNQYHVWLTGLLQGDLGYSYRDRQPVLTILGAAIGNTLFLLVFSLFFTFWISMELSLALMAESGRRWRRPTLALLFALDSVPLFILALLLLVFLAGTGYLSWFPLFGLGYANPDAPVWEVLIDRLYHLVLPGICLVLSGIPYVTTQLYRVMQQVAGAAFIMTARSKGLSASVVLRRHVFRNALLPLITLFTGFLPSLISGAVVVEIIFAIPGTGRLLADSVLARDYPVVLGLVFFLATLKAVSHLLADFLYFTTDPRTRVKIV